MAHPTPAAPTDSQEKIQELTMWGALAGTHWYDQVKTVFAAIGLLTLVSGVLRSVR